MAMPHCSVILPHMLLRWKKSYEAVKSGCSLLKQKYFAINNDIVGK